MQPWGEVSQDNYDLDTAKRILDEVWIDLGPWMPNIACTWLWARRHYNTFTITLYPGRTTMDCRTLRSGSSSSLPSATFAATLTARFCVCVAPQVN